MRTRNDAPTGPNRHQRRAAAAAGKHQDIGCVSSRPDGSCRISDGNVIDKLIVATAAAGFVGRVELLRAVRNREIALVEPERSMTVPADMLATRRPTIVVLGDDDYASTGPTGWAAFPALLKWATGAMIHGTGGDAASYQMAIGGALARHRFVLIETDTAHLREWGDALIAAKVPFFALRSYDGVHPKMPDRSKMQ